VTAPISLTARAQPTRCQSTSAENSGSDQGPYSRIHSVATIHLPPSTSGWRWVGHTAQGPNVPQPASETVKRACPCQGAIPLYIRCPDAPTTDQHNPISNNRRSELPLSGSAPLFRRRWAHRLPRIMARDSNHIHSRKQSQSSQLRSDHPATNHFQICILHGQPTLYFPSSGPMQKVWTNTLPRSGHKRLLLSAPTCTIYQLSQASSLVLNPFSPLDDRVEPLHCP
jgi:hypothetical protein